MKHIVLVCSIIGVLFLGSCKENLIDKMQPKSSKSLKQARARLVAVKKWGIDEVEINGVLVYSKSNNIYDEYKIDVSDFEFVRFTDDGIFEVKILNEPINRSIKYVLDEKNSSLQLISEEEDGEKYFENYTINSGSVYESSFSMTSNDFDADEKFKIKMIEIK